VPHELAHDNKAATMMVFLSSLQRCAAEGNNCLREVVAGDETRIHHFTPTSKRSPMEWKLSGSHSKKCKVTPPAGSADHRLLGVVTCVAGGLPGKRMHCCVKSFGDFTWCHFVVRIQQFGTTCLSHLQGLKVNEEKDVRR
jgi:hypothetical protein